MKKRGFIAVLFLLLLVSLAAAHGDESEPEEKPYRLDEIIKKTSMKSVLVGTAIIALLVVIAVATEKKRSDLLSWILMIGLAIPIIVITLYVTGATIYLNVVSETGGPVHWHADFEFWNCGEKLDLIDPTGLLNRVGTSSFHEHNDDRIHVEGTVYKKKFVDLHTFLAVVGGELNQGFLALPTNQDTIFMRDGDLCNGDIGILQVYLYRITNPNPYSRSGFTYEQVKLDNYADYILSPYINVPPGDCLIFEFGPEREFTDKLCESYKVAEQRGDITKI